MKISKKNEYKVRQLITKNYFQTLLLFKFSISRVVEKIFTNFQIVSYPARVYLDSTTFAFISISSHHHHASPSPPAKVQFQVAERREWRGHQCNCPRENKGGGGEARKRASRLQKQKLSYLSHVPGQLFFFFLFSFSLARNFSSRVFSIVFAILAIVYFDPSFEGAVGKPLPPLRRKLKSSFKPSFHLTSEFFFFLLFSFFSF